MTSKNFRYLFARIKNNISPRLGSPESVKGMGFPGRFGLFYDRLPLAFLDPAIQKNGALAFEQVAFDSVAAQVFTANGGGKVLATVPNIAPSVYRSDPSFKTPHSMQTFAGVERLIASDTTVRAEFFHPRPEFATHSQYQFVAARYFDICECRNARRFESNTSTTRTPRIRHRSDRFPF